MDHESSGAPKAGATSQPSPVPVDAGDVAFSSPDGPVPKRNWARRLLGNIIGLLFAVAFAGGIFLLTTGGLGLLDAGPSKGPITSPAAGSADRQFLIGKLQAKLETTSSPVVEHIFVQGTRAAAVLKIPGRTGRYVVVWENVLWNWNVAHIVAVGPGSKADLRDPQLRLSEELIGKLGL